MKHVFSNRLLGPVVLSIWAGVVFRFSDVLQPGNDSLITQKEDLTIVPVIEFDKKPELLLNYGDPFALFGAQSPALAAALQSPAFPQKPVLPPPSSPDIVYLGGVKHAHSASLTGVISLNGHSRIIREGDTLNGLHIRKLAPGFVTLGADHQTITINRQLPSIVFP